MDSGDKGSFISRRDETADPTNQMPRKNGNNDNHYTDYTSEQNSTNVIGSNKRPPLPPFSFGKKPAFPIVALTAQQLQQQQQQQYYHQVMMMNGNGNMMGEGETTPFTPQPFFPYNFATFQGFPPTNGIPMMPDMNYANYANQPGTFYFVPAAMQPMMPVMNPAAGQFLPQDPTMVNAMESASYFPSHPEHEPSRSVYYAQDDAPHYCTSANDSFEDCRRLVAASSSSQQQQLPRSRIETKLDEKGKKVVKIDTIHRDERLDDHIDGKETAPGRLTTTEPPPRASNSKEPSGAIPAPPSRCLFVRNASKRVDYHTFHEIFSKCGSVAHLDTTKHKQKGILFVTFNDIRDAKRAMRQLQNKCVDDRKITAHYSLPKPFNGKRPICGQKDFQGSLSVMMGDMEVDGDVLDEMRRIFERFGPLRAFKFSRPNKRGKFYISYYDCRHCATAVEEMDGERFRRARMSVKLEWDHERMHEGEEEFRRNDSVNPRDSWISDVHGEEPPSRVKRRFESVDEEAAQQSASSRRRTESIDGAPQPSASAPSLFVIDKRPDPRLAKAAQPLLSSSASLESLYKTTSLPSGGAAETEAQKGAAASSMENLAPPPLLTQMNALMESLHERRPSKAEPAMKPVQRSFGHEFEVEIDTSSRAAAGHEDNNAHGVRDRQENIDLADDDDDDDAVAIPEPAKIAPSTEASPTKEPSVKESPVKVAKPTPPTAESVQRLAHLILQQNQMRSLY